VTPTSLSPMPAWLSSAWLARYLERQLAPDEVAWFEAYVLDKPELLSMIEADTRLRDAMAADAQNVRTGGVGSGHAEVAQEWPTDAHVGVPPTALRTRNPAWFGLAAALVLGLGSGWFGQRAFSPAPDILMANPTRLVFDTLRGTQSPAQVERAESASPYVLVEVAVPPGALHVMLDLDRQQPVALSQSADGFVSFLVARPVLGADDAVIRYELDGQQRVRDIPLSQLAGSTR
jgi:hypothetical protein